MNIENRTILISIRYYMKDLNIKKTLDKILKFFICLKGIDRWIILLYNDNINKKYKQEDLEDKYINTNIEVEVKNEKYIAGREGSKKYIELSLEQIMKKDLSEFTYLFSDVTFEIIKIDKNKQGRIVNIIVREKEKKKE